MDRAARARRGESKISEISTRVYDVPTDQPEADGTLSWSSTTVVVVEIRAESALGLGWTYASSACKSLIDETLAPLVLGSDPASVTGTHEEMVRRCRNFGRPGLIACAVSAVDIALWDLKARLFDVSLSDLFGRCHDSVPVYGSGGFTTYDDATATAQLEHWVDALGVAQVKIKIGESWGANVRRDLARVAHARTVIGDDIGLFVDANGGYSRKQAVRVGVECSDAFGVTWFEEPVSSDDLAGLREVRDQLRCDVAAGEYGYDEAYFARMVQAQSVDCVQIDVTRCGGYTSWLRVAAIAAANGLDVSGHCAPSLHAPVAAAVPNLRHVEYFHDHERVDTLLFEGVRIPSGGVMDLRRGDVGHGMSLRAGATFRVA